MCLTTIYSTWGGGQGEGVVHGCPFPGFAGLLNPRRGKLSRVLPHADESTGRPSPASLRAARISVPAPPAHGGGFEGVLYPGQTISLWHPPAGQEQAKIDNPCTQREKHMSVAGEQYVIDEHGNRVAVILPLQEYEQLQEDLHDLAVVAERRKDPIIEFSEFRKRYEQ